MFIDAVEQEKTMGTITCLKMEVLLDLNAELLKQYVEFIAAKRMRRSKLRIDI